MQFTTYVINMDSAPERLYKVVGVLRGIGIDPVRIRGNTRADIPEDKIDHHFSVFCKSFCPDSVLGCAFSHMSAMKRFLLSGDPFCLIVEDDVTPLFDHVSVLESKLDKIKNKRWDIHSLHCDGKCPETGRDTGAYARSGSTAAYFVSREGAQALVNHKIHTHFDLALSIDPSIIKIIDRDNYFSTDETSSSNRDPSPGKKSILYHTLKHIQKPTRGEKTADDILKYSAIKNISAVKLVEYSTLILALIPAAYMRNPKGVKISVALATVVLVISRVTLEI